MSSYTLHLGDCLQFMRGMDAGSVDAVVTDPQYGMNWNTDTTRFSGGKSPLIVRTKEVRTNGDGRNDWGSIIGDDTPFDPSPFLCFKKVILWGSNHYAQRLPVGTTLVWIKRSDNHFGTFLSDAEIGWMRGGYGVYCFRKQFPPPSRAAEGNGVVLHPTQKPIALMKWCIEKVTKPGDTVFDPYMGSGTTGVACMQLGRNFIGVEIEERYFKIAERRIAQAAAQLILPLEGTSHA